MAQFNGSQYDNFQFDPGSIGSDWLSGSQPAMRPLASRVSRFNINYMGPRDSNNVYKTSLGYGFKGTIENPKKEVGVGFGTDRDAYNYNPYIWGLAVAHQRMLNDSMFIMGMYHSGTNLSGYGDSGASIDAPKKDVSDKKAVEASGMSAYVNYPTEGYSSFGKKGDKERAWAGNTWING